METKNKITLRGELALALAVLVNSFAVAMTVYAGLGISPVSSFPYAVSLVFPFFTLGTWTYLFQGVLVITLMVLRKRFVPSYLFSFVVGFFFGKMLDLHQLWTDQLPVNLPLRVLYFALSYFLICFGIALSNRCRMPIIPTDLFPRELASITGWPYARIKVSFDLICLGTTAAMTLLFLGRLDGLGIGTVLAAATMGKAIAWIGGWMDRYVTFTSILDPAK